jgi:hypothetical protein
MAIRRQQNFLGQERVDVADLRAIESAAANDFDMVLGRLWAGASPLVVKGFAISTTGAYNQPADQLQIAVASGILLHYGASDSGTLYVADDNAAAEVLSATNAKVSGSFAASSTNYIGLDLQRSADSATSDLKQFIDAAVPTTEIPNTVPTARTLNYKIIVSTQPFSVSSNVCPIAKVVTNANNLVVSVTDARSMLFRLGSGGDSPDVTHSYVWADTTRAENNITYSATSTNDPFTGGDKTITSMKGWMDAVMSRLWELGSGQYWYSPTKHDNIKLIYGTVTFPTTDNFSYNSGTGVLSWTNLKVAFENSTVYYNDITDGSATFTADGQCLYVDVSRSSNGSPLVPAIGNLITLGLSTTLPGSRLIIAWRHGNNIFTRDRAYEVGRQFAVATTTTVGTVKLSQAATTPSSPIVLVDAEKNTASGVAALTAAKSVIGSGLDRDATLGAGGLSIGTSANTNAITISRTGVPTAIADTVTSTFFAYPSTRSAYAIISPHDVDTMENINVTLNGETTASGTAFSLAHTSTASFMEVGGRARIPATATVTGVQLLYSYTGAGNLSGVTCLAAVINITNGTLAGSPPFVAETPNVIYVHDPAASGVTVTAATAGWIAFASPTSQSMPGAEGPQSAFGNCGYFRVSVHVPLLASGVFKIYAIKVLYTYTALQPLT